MAREQGWLAEHMLILKLTSPEGVVKYLAGAFPSACGKTNLAMMIPELAGWKVETIGDDIAWMKFGADGRLYAINPEAGFFGVAPGTSPTTNPQRAADDRANTIFTNTARTDDGEVWWEGMTKTPPAHLIDWHGNDWTPESGTPGGAPQRALHASPRRRTRRWRPSGRTRPACRSTRSCSAAGAPRSCRSCTRPSTGSTASSSARRWRRRRPPRRPARSASCAATRSRCCRSAATTWATTSPTGSRSAATHDRAKLPRIFHVNWFRKGEDGRFLWPGYGENIRVLEWIFRRCEGSAEAVRDADRHASAGRERSTSRASRSPTERSSELLRASTSTRGAPRSSRSASTSRPSASSCRRSSRRSSTRCESRLQASVRGSAHAPIPRSVHAPVA